MEETKSTSPTIKSDTIASSSGRDVTIESTVLKNIGALEETTYTFSIDSLRITNTRSLHNDTDFATASVTVGTGTPQTQTKSLGDLNNGTHLVGMSFSGIVVPAGQNVVLSYAVVNAGHASPSEVQTLLTKAGDSLANTAAQAAAKAIGGAIGAEIGSTLGSAAVPIIGTALGALAGWLFGELAGLAFADCDGPVAAGVHVFSAADLAKPQSQTDYTPGVDSSDGCGSNSQYYVTWSTSAQQRELVTKKL